MNQVDLTSAVDYASSLAVEFDGTTVILAINKQPLEGRKSVMSIIKNQKQEITPCHIIPVGMSEVELKNLVAWASDRDPTHPVMPENAIMEISEDKISDMLYTTLTAVNEDICIETGGTFPDESCGVTSSVDPPCFMKSSKVHFMVDMSLNVKHFNVFYYKEILRQFLDTFEVLMPKQLSSFKISTITGSFDGHPEIQQIVDSTVKAEIDEQISANIKKKEGVVKADLVGIEIANMRANKDLAEDEVVIVLISTPPEMAMRVLGNPQQNVMFVLNNLNQYQMLTATYTPNDEYLFLDTSFTAIHKATAFIQQRFCKLTSPDMNMTETFTPGHGQHMTYVLNLRCVKNTKIVI